LIRSFPQGLWDISRKLKNPHAQAGEPRQDCRYHCCDFINSIEISIILMLSQNPVSFGKTSFFTKTPF
jgi:hypothetical protein